MANPSLSPIAQVTMTDGLAQRIDAATLCVTPLIAGFVIKSCANPDSICVRTSLVNALNQVLPFFTFMMVVGAKNKGKNGKGC